ncbi:MAG: DNA-binding response regulator [Anaerolineaceae bacterium]|nr:DNA-binding response regulator [Anaerolineaceae bacterium]
MKIKILLVDDHVNVRQGLRKMLSRSPKVEIVGEAGNGVEALELVEHLNPDVMLLDVEMPGMNGYEVARRVMDSENNVRVLALSGYDDKRYILGMFSSGAVGYITKDEAPNQLLQAVQEVASGYKGWISPRVAEKLGVPARPKGRDTIPALSLKETQVLRKMTQGKTDREIMQELNMDRSTIKDCVQSIIWKLGVTTRLEAVLRAMQEGLV